MTPSTRDVVNNSRDVIISSIYC